MRSKKLLLHFKSFKLKKSSVSEKEEGREAFHGCLLPNRSLPSTDCAVSLNGFLTSLAVLSCVLVIHVCVCTSVGVGSLLQVS